MAFCNSCGATLAEGTKFCSKCGAVAPASAAAATPAPVTPAAGSGGGSSALKIILIIVGVIVLLGILGVGAVSYIGYRAVHAVKNSHVSQDGDDVKVETPFGTMKSSKDPDQAEKDLGVDIYPGAEVQKDGASTADVMGIHTATAKFKSGDSMDKICSFYKEKFPSAMSSAADSNRCSIISNDRGTTITIHVEPDGDGSKFQVTSMTKAK